MFGLLSNNLLKVNLILFRNMAWYFKNISIVHLLYLFGIFSHSHTTLNVPDLILFGIFILSINT